MSDFTVNILGCGSAKPSLRHQPSCTVLEIKQQLYMIDCGEGAQLQMQRMGLKFNRLNHIFLTHLHGDHVFGLPGLIGSMGLMKREGYVTIHTFPQGKEIISNILDFFCQDLPFEVRFNLFEPAEQTILQTEDLKVRTLPLRHRVPCVGYVFESSPSLPHLDRKACDFHGVPQYMYAKIKRGEDFTTPEGKVISHTLLTKPASPPPSYAHIGDTSYLPHLAPKIGPVSLLYHESTYLSDLLPTAAQRGHSTAAQAAEMARLCGASRLLLGHYSSRYRDDSLFSTEARKIFPASTPAYEGLRIAL